MTEIRSKTEWVNAAQLRGNAIDTDGLAKKIDATIERLSAGRGDRVVTISVAVAGAGYSALVTVCWKEP
ncbi:hypothetical protein [Miltoncostaea oceani]|uniref:hypothetical protein n=1 Tax=Miltoncostaea oceani TaxID=2843216 RepID=UPI001C3E3EAC|nr:hypothetical protein [Miltoncostaea oceani]